jgi:ketosteroid isomerase-like protein
MSFASALRLTLLGALTLSLALTAPTRSALFAADGGDPAVPRAPADSALHAEVAALNNAMVAAFETEPATVARFYADSARIVGPRRQTVAGRTAIDRYWASIRKPATWKLDVIEVGGSRAEAYQIGVSSLTSTGSDGQSRTYVCDFVVIWKRQADGTLRIMLDLYN